MEKFKDILRFAVKQKALCVKLVDGSIASVTTADGEHEHKETGHVDLPLLSTLYDFLFPYEKEALEQDKPVKGILNIPTVGKLNLIGRKGSENYIKLFFPQNQDQFEAEWEKAQVDTGLNVPPLRHDSVEGLDKVPFPENSSGKNDKDSAFPPLGNIDQPLPKEALEDTGAAPMEAEAISAPALADDGIDALKIPFPSLGGSDSESALPPPPMGIGGDLSESPTSGAIGIDEENSQGVSDHDFPSSHALSGTSSEAISLDQQGVHQVEPNTQGFPLPDQGEVSRLQIVDQDEASKPPTQWQESPTMFSEPLPLGDILNQGIDKQASDIYLCHGEPLLCRIHGDIVRQGGDHYSSEQIQQLLQPIMSTFHLAQLQESRDTEFGYEIRGTGRFRVKIFYSYGGVNAVFRMIPSSPLSPDQIGLPRLLFQLCHNTSGLILVASPRASGKTTTMATIVDFINQNKQGHILTVEDPIEFIHKSAKCHVTQRQVFQHTQSVEHALANGLHENPDYVVISEISKTSTFEHALNLAESGLLVIATINQSSVVDTIERFVEKLPSERQQHVRWMLSHALRGVISQVLVRKKTGERMAAYEALLVDEAVANMIREAKSHMILSHMQAQKAEGQRTLPDSLVSLCREGHITEQEALRHYHDKKLMIELGKRAGVNFETPQKARTPSKPLKPH